MKASYTVKSTNRPGQAAPVYAIRVTDRTGREGFIVGDDGDALFFPDKATANARLKQMKADDNYSWNCEAEAVEFKGWR